jgi:murein DD-endopeptidase MepM/ murein hydrolase activator NlpD
MANESYTLIFVPHARGRFRKFHVPVRVARWSAGAVGALGLALAAVLGHYAWLTSQAIELDVLRAENHELSEKTRQYEQNVSELESQIAVLQRNVNKLGVMSGVEQILPDADLGGVGGVSASESFPPSLDQDLSLRSLTDSVSDLAARSARIEDFYKDQQALFAHTPSVWPVRGYLSSSFGNRIDPFTGLKDFHPGIDISTPRGSKITAPADGVIVSIGRKGAYGNAIIIDHGYGVVTRYGHLDGFEVRAGQRVKRGDVIGYVGATGRANAPHLHYEVWVREKLQNPIHFILDEYRSFG